MFQYHENATQRRVGRVVFLTLVPFALHGAPAVAQDETPEDKGPAAGA